MAGERKPKDSVTIKTENGNLKLTAIQVPKVDIKKSVNYNASLTRSNGTVFIKPFDQLELEMIVRDNLMASRCIDVRIQATAGKGWTENTADEVKKIFKKSILERLVYDIDIVGEYYAEVKIVKQRPLKYKHCPACTMSITDDQKHAVQYAGSDNEIKLPLFDEEEFLKGKYPDGSYIIHKIKYMGNSVYGIPSWIGAIDLLRIMDNSEKDILNFYDNDAIAKTIMMIYGIPDPTNKMASELKRFLESNYQGNDKKDKIWIMTGLPAKEFGKMIDFKELNKNIVDGNYLAYMDKNDTKVCVAFAVPIELLGVQTAGSLGNSQMLDTLLFMFNDNSILPVQDTLTDPIKVFYPDQEVQLKVMKLPEQTEEQIIEMKKKAEEQFVNLLNRVLQLISEREET